MVKMSNCQTVLFKTPKIQHYLQNGWQNNRKYLHPPRRMYFILFVQLNNIVSTRTSRGLGVNRFASNWWLLASRLCHVRLSKKPWLNGGKVGQHVGSGEYLLSIFR